MVFGNLWMIFSIADDLWFRMAFDGLFCFTYKDISTIL